MITETEGIVIRQTKTAYGRRMIVLLTKKYGKISAGTSITEGGKNKSALALRPFTRGRYELFKGRDSYSINGAETIESYYSIGEDIEKYSCAAGALELADKMLEDEQQAQGMYNLLSEYLSILEKRKSDFGTLFLAFRIKALELFGSGINVKSCVKCGKTDGLKCISVPDGGAVCEDCAGPSAELNPLIFDAGDDIIIKIIDFIQAHPLRALEKLSVPDQVKSRMTKILKAWYSYHLGIEGLKSESLVL
ncbi:MAG: DNA repair protein RecO [Firmicutes bacterium]|nr:DNA repair protein RecO [Bacillota bacterium]